CPFRAKSRHGFTLRRLEMQKVTELPMELPGRLGPMGWSAIIPERSIQLTRGHRQTPVMIFYDRPADRQPNDHTVRFCRKEWLEDAVDVPWIDANSGVFHRDQQIV